MSKIFNVFNRVCSSIWVRSIMFISSFFASSLAFAQQGGMGGGVQTGTAGADVGFLRFFTSLSNQAKGGVAFLIVIAFAIGCWFLYLAWMAFSNLSDEQKRRQENLVPKFFLYAFSGAGLVFFSLTPIIFGEALFGAEQNTANEVNAADFGF